MPYTITASEKTAKSAADAETKALLYLMNFHKHKDEIDFFVIDFFNDVTGLHRLEDEAYDMQSKANTSINAKNIGRFLVTLFKNYLSDLKFMDFILFVGGIAKTALINSNLSVFGIDNFTDRAKNSIKAGLIEEAKKKTYIDNTDVTNKNINDFLQLASFVIDNKSKEDYIKSIINGKFVIKDEDKYLQKIFDQIKDSQIALKTNDRVEGITINALSDFQKYNRHLKVNDIKIMVLSRLLNKNSLTDVAIPISFANFVTSLGKSDGDTKDLIEECKDNLFRMICDKNNAGAYWDLFAEICEFAISTNSQKYSIENIFDKLDRAKITKISFLDRNSTLYFIALVKDSIKI
jgi:hypothetical protein